jgi:hypothetical protein
MNLPAAADYQRGNAIEQMTWEGLPIAPRQRVCYRHRNKTEPR